MADKTRKSREWQTTSEASVWQPLLAVIVISMFIGLVAGCQSRRTAGNIEPYNPRINPSYFTVSIDNPYCSLVPVTTFTYESKTDDGIEMNKVVVTNATKQVMGVTCRVVWDRVWLNDELIEETYDWYAQDKKGNVWYFGEDSREYENGKVVSTKGSWEAGIDGAMPGVIMKAKPQLGEPYRQEYYKDEAEDMAEVVSLDETVTVPYAAFGKCIKTKDWSRLDPDVVEYKYYSSITGSVVLETAEGNKTRVELIDITGGSEKKK